MQEKLSEIESDYQSSEDKLKQFELNLKEVLKENKVLKEKLEISYQEKHDMESNLNEALREQRLLKKKNVELNTEVESLKQFTKDLESSLSSRQLEQEEIDDLKQKRKLLDKIPSSIGPFSSFLDIQQIEGEKKWECTCKCPSNDKSMFENEDILTNHVQLIIEFTELEFFLEIMDDGLVEYVPLGGSMKSKTFDLSDLPEYLGKIIHFNESHIPQFIAKMISYLHNTKM